jgi:hypothetical protein
VFSGSGKGVTATAPFEVAAGQFRLSYEVRTSGRPWCPFGFALEATDHGYRSEIGDDGAGAYETAPYRNQTWFYVPTGGRYFLDVGGSCDWEVQLESLPSPLEGAPVTVSGTGLGVSPSFTLDAGDYVVRYTLTSPLSGDDCTIEARGIVDPASPSASPGGGIKTTIAEDTTYQGETYVYGLEAGRYAYEVNSAGCEFYLAEPVAWTVAIEGP